MTSLTEFLFPAPARRSFPSILGWWERRRLAYNAFVGGAGVVSVVGVALLSLIHPYQTGILIIPWQPIVAFGLGANLFYSLGSLAEWAVHRIWGREILPVGPGLYRIGLTFSVGLALFPLMALSVITIVAMPATVMLPVLEF